MTWIRAHALHARLRGWMVTIAPLLVVVVVVAGQCSGGSSGY
jgi:hypothetical protein